MQNPTLLALDNLQEQFKNGILAKYEYRISLLKRIRSVILQQEEALYAALQADLHKCREESWVTEIGIIIAEIDHAIKYLKKWMRPQRVPTNLVNLPSSSFIYPEPLGVVLLIAPWNYPFMLLMNPLIGALAAGNTVVLKPSEYAPETEAVIKKIIELSNTKAIALFCGDGAEVVPALMHHFKFDHVFFTGGYKVAQKIYEMAATKLVPVTLELGGKSPCVLEADANITVAAKRITVGKFSNAGQICIAPDYILVHSSKKAALVQAIRSCILKFYGDDTEKSPEYCRIINNAQFQRLQGYLKNGVVLHGGETNESTRFIGPTLIEVFDINQPIMQEEIFGPILPIISFDTREQALAIIEKHPNPLAFYIFTQSIHQQESWLRAVPAGTACCNNTAWQFTNPHLPFGGRGQSGIGAAHGKFTFDRFTHFKAVLKSPAWFDPAIKYPPMKGKLQLFKKMIG